MHLGCQRDLPCDLLHKSPVSAAQPHLESVLLAAPRGWCAGVARAVEAVEAAVDRFGPPLYVRHAIVHNEAVVERLERRGVVFVDELSEVPEATRVVFSAHGVAPAVREEAAERDLQVIDATCPLVTKVHVEARRFAAAGYTVVLIAHRGHVEAIGTMGEAPERIVLVEDASDVDALEVPDPERVAWVSQTTLAVGETRDLVERLRKRFPRLAGPRTEDICFATTNRQAAVAALAERAQLVLVIGSTTSSNSRRLVEVGRARDIRTELVSGAEEVPDAWLEGVRVVGVSAGASTPEDLVQALVDRLRDAGATRVEELEVARERVRFMPPEPLRREAAARA